MPREIHTNTFEKGMLQVSSEKMPGNQFSYGINGRLDYHNQELSYTNKNGTLLITPTGEFSSNVEEIMGGYCFLDEIILFTKNNGSSDGKTWSLKQTGNTTFSFTILHEGSYGFITGKKLVCKGADENEHYRRVYFTDGINPYRKINVKSNVLNTLSIEELNVFPTASNYPCTIISIENGGSVNAMSVQYTYRLINEDGSVTPLAILSPIVQVLENYDTNLAETGGLAGDDTGKVITIQATNIDINKFKSIEFFAVEYQAKNTITGVKTLGLQNLSNSTVTATHTGSESDASVSIDEILSNQINFKSCSEIEIFENLMLVSDIQYYEALVDNFDAKLLQSDNLGSVFNDIANPDPKSYRYIPGFFTGVNICMGGRSANYINGNGIQITFGLEGMAVANTDDTRHNHVDIDLSLSNFDSGLGAYPSIRYAKEKAGYQRGEIYRIGIKFSKLGLTSWVKYVGDIQIPTVDDDAKTLINDSTTNFLNVANSDLPNKYLISEFKNAPNETWAYSIKLQIKLNLPQEILDSFDTVEIVRAKRNSWDKTIMDQGVLFPFEDADPNPSGGGVKYPEAFNYKTGVALGKAITLDNAGLYRKEWATYNTNSPKIYSLDTPRTVSQQEDYEINAGTRLNMFAYVKPIASIIGRYNYRQDNVEFYYDNWRHVLYKYDYSKNEIVDVDKHISLGTNGLVSGSLFGKTKNIVNVALGNFMGEKYDAVYRPHYTDIKDQRKRLTSAAPTLVINVTQNGSEYAITFRSQTFNGSDYTGIEFLNPNKFQVDPADGQIKEMMQYVERNDHPLLVNGDLVYCEYIVANLERDLSGQYGGKTEQALKETNYINCKTVALNNNSSLEFDVWGGDTWVDLFHHMKFSKKDTAVMEMEAYSESVSSSYSIVLETDRPQIFAKGIKVIKDGPNIDTGDVYVYNDAYISENAKLSVPEPLNNKEVLDFKNLIQVSELKFNGDYFDAWSIFNAENFHELNLKDGRITNLVNLKNFVFAIQETQLTQLYINSRAMVASEDNRSIAIEQKNTVNVEYSKPISKYGTTFRDSVAVGENSFMYFDDINRKLVLFQGQAIVISEMTFIQNQLNEFLKNKTITRIVGTYDEQYTELILTIFTSEGNYTICYNEKATFQSFNGYSDFHGNQYFQFRDLILIEHSNKNLYILNKGTKGNAFGVIKDMELEFVVNSSVKDVKVFDNFIGTMQSNNIKFKEIRYSTNLIAEQVLYSNDDRYKIREGKHLIPLRQKGFNRMRGDWMKIKIIFSNTDNVDISISQINTIFRKSFK